MNDDMNDLKVSVARIETTVDHMSRSVDRLQTLLDTVNSHGTRIEVLETRVKTLEDGKNWVIKIVVGAVLVALVGIVVVKPSAIWPVAQVQESRTR